MGLYVPQSYEETPSLQVLDGLPVLERINQLPTRRPSKQSELSGLASLYSPVPHMAHSHTVHPPLGALLIRRTVCGPGDGL